MTGLPPLHVPRLSSTARLLWPWLPLWLLLAMLAVFSHGPMPLYSTRTLAVAWEMWSQHQFIVPHLNGVPYPDKVPLLYWLIHAGWWLTGVNNIWPRLLEVLLGATTLGLAATLAQRLAPRQPQVARASGWLLASLGYAFLFSLQMMYDVLLAVWVLAALLSLTPRDGRGRPRFVLFGLCIALGLLSKGPVMLLHVAFPWLLGPVWSEWARRHRSAWYGWGVLATVGGLLLFAAWLWPATQLGGEAYTQALLFKQTSGRMVSAFVHVRPLWWYLPVLLVLFFPLCLWPRVWWAVGTMRAPLDRATRFALCWVLPVLACFSLISSKQMYYLIPELGGMAMLVAVALARLQDAQPAWQPRWLRPWPAALLAWLAGSGMLLLPALVAHGQVQDHWFVDLANVGLIGGLVFMLLGVLVVLPGRHELQRVALAGLAGAFACHAMFTLTQWQNYDIRPTAELVSRLQQQGRTIAKLGTGYEGEYHFLGRLRQPVVQLQPGQLAAWITQHPRGMVITDPDKLDAAVLRYAVQIQPFRGDWLVVWRASVLGKLRSGDMPVVPAQPAKRVPAGYWRYRQVP